MSLKNILTQLIAGKPAVGTFESILRAAGCPVKLIEVAKKEEFKSLAVLEFLAEKSDESELETKLRLFLKQRWALIHRTDLSYTTFPHHPLNQICIHLAKALVKQEEVWAEVLMPTLRIKNYDITGDSLVDLTEISEGGVKQLALHDFLVSEDGRAVIPLCIWFQSQADNGSEFFNHLYSIESKLIPLSSREENWLRHAAMPMSENFFEEFKFRYKMTRAKSTLAEATLRLCDGLMENGQGKKGNTLVAHDDVFDYIREFAQVLSKIPAGDVDKILQLKDKLEPLSHYWGIITGHASTNVDDAWRTCVEANSVNIRHILEAHPEIFASIRLDASLETEVVALTPFSLLLSSIRSKIAARKSSLASGALTGGEPVLKIYFVNTQHYLDRKLSTYLWHLDNFPNQSLPIRIQKLADLDFYYSFLQEDELNTRLSELSDEIQQEIYNESVKSENTFFAEFLLSSAYFKPKPLGLMAAIQANKIDLVRAWIKAKHEISQCCTSNILEVRPMTPLCAALNKKHFAIAKLLIEAGADLTQRYGEYQDSILVWAIFQHLDDIVKALIIKKVPLENLEDKYFSTALHVAVKSMSFSLVRLFLDLRLDINAKDSGGFTALHLSVMHYNLDIISLLLERRADHSAVTVGGETPYIWLFPAINYRW